MAKKRGNNEGSIVHRKDGRWMVQMTVSRDAKTGKLKRPTFYGKTRKEVAEKLAMLRPTTYDTYEMIASKKGGCQAERGSHGRVAVRLQ